MVSYSNATRKRGKKTSSSLKTNSSGRGRSMHKRSRSSRSNEFDKCASLKQVKNELEKLIVISKMAGDNDMAKTFTEQLDAFSKRRTPSSSRMVGGASTMCHVITTAMFLTSSAAITYLTYHNVLPVVTRAMPKVCEGRYDQFLGSITGLWNKKNSCAARQAAWDRLREKVLASVVGVQGMALVMDKALLGKSKFKSLYNKVLTWNEANLCPLFSSFSLASTSKVKNAACIMLTAPFKALFAVGRSVTHTLEGHKNPLAELYGQSFSSDGSSSSSSSFSSSSQDSSRGSKRLSRKSTKSIGIGTNVTMEDLAKPVELSPKKRDIITHFKPLSLKSRTKSPNSARRLANMKYKSH
jgi:hypothetical protein